MYILSADTLIEEALNAHRIGEVIVRQCLNIYLMALQGISVP